MSHPFCTIKSIWASPASPDHKQTFRDEQLPKIGLKKRDCFWPQVQVEAKKEKAKKYAIKPPRDLRSKYELRQEEKQQTKEQAAEEKKQKEEEEKKAVRS